MAHQNQAQDGFDQLMRLAMIFESRAEGHAKFSVGDAVDQVQSSFLACSGSNQHLIEWTVAFSALIHAIPKDVDVFPVIKRSISAAVSTEFFPFWLAMSDVVASIFEARIRRVELSYVSLFMNSQQQSAVLAGLDLVILISNLFSSTRTEWGPPLIALIERHKSSSDADMILAVSDALDSLR